MRTNKPSVLALDLESTLISNAVSQFARPGLRAFLEWALESFQRVVLFTAVPEEHALGILRMLVEVGDAPAGASAIAYVRWTGKVKDLAFVSEATVRDILIVDDQERYILPEHRQQWIRIEEWDAPYADTDRELDRVRGLLENRLRD